MSDQARKQRIIALLTMPAKKIATLDENELITMVQEVEAIKQESVRDNRFLGKLKRRR